MAPTGQLVHWGCDAAAMNDHWKLVFGFYIKWYKNDYCNSILLRCATMYYPSMKCLKYSKIYNQFFEISWGD